MFDKTIKTQKEKEDNKIVEKHNISEEKFVVMPKKYISDIKKVSGATSVFNKKFFFLLIIILIVLTLAALILYILFYPKDQTTEDNFIPQQQDVSQEASSEFGAEEAADDSEEPELKTIYAQAFDESNTLVGSIEMQVPQSVTQVYGSGIGITTLNSEDLSLPENQITGGIFSVYPSGVTFEETISLKISFSTLPDGVNQEDLKPAYLRGVEWQEFEDYQADDSGFSFVLEKFPSGPIAIILGKDDDSSDVAIDFQKPQPSEDSDEDGLTDAEEVIFGTNASLADSDEDTYLDLEEIKNGYSPILSDRAIFAESEIFAEYTNSTYGYKVTYPVKWLANSLDRTNKQVLFISETEEFFEILIEENPLDTPIVDWYRSQSPSLESVDLDVVLIDSAPAVWSVDGLTLYTSKDGLIYIITYNRGTREDINWPNIFDYFYKSFKFGNTSGIEESQDDAG